MNLREELLRRNHWSQGNISLEKMFYSKPNSPKTKFDNFFHKTSTGEKKKSVTPDRSPNNSRNHIETNLKELLATYDHPGNRTKSKTTSNPSKKDKANKKSKPSTKKQLDLHEGLNNYDNQNIKFYNLQHSGSHTTKNNLHSKKNSAKYQDQLNLNLGSILAFNNFNSIKTPMSMKNVNYQHAESVPQTPQEPENIVSNEYNAYELNKKKPTEKLFDRRNEMIYYKNLDFDDLKETEFKKEAHSKSSTPKNASNIEPRKMHGIQKFRSVAKQETAETFDGDSKSKYSAKNPSISTTDQEKLTNGSKKHSPSRNQQESQTNVLISKYLNQKDPKGNKETYVDYMKTLYHKKRQENQSAKKIFYSKPASDLICNTSDDYKSLIKNQIVDGKNLKLDIGSKNFQSMNIHKDSNPNLLDGSHSTREFLALNKNKTDVNVNRKLSLEDYSNQLINGLSPASKMKIETCTTKNSNEIAIKIQGQEIKINPNAKFLNLRSQIKRKRSNTDLRGGEFFDSSKNTTDRKAKNNEILHEEVIVSRERPHSIGGSNQYYDLLKILNRTSKILNDYKKKESTWENEKKLLLAEINILKEKYE